MDSLSPRPDPLVDLHRRGPAPKLSIDLLNRLPLTRPSSPRCSSSELYEEKKCEPGLRRDPESSEPLITRRRSPTLLLELLPLEIRRQIWELVVGGRRFYLYPREVMPYEPWETDRVRRLGAFECSIVEPSSCDATYHARFCMPKKVLTTFPRKELLPLLLTCRQIYIEAIDYLYASNAFIVDNVEVIEYHAIYLLPQRINSIQSLEVTWGVGSCPPLGRVLKPRVPKWPEIDRRRATWIATWKFLAGMENLKHLHFKLQPRHDTYWASFDTESAKALMDPIREVKVPKFFTISLPFPPDVKGNPRRCKISRSWAAEKDWEGVDPWDELPCMIRRREDVTQL